MERIKLTKSEKVALRNVNNGRGGCVPIDMDARRYGRCVFRLQQLGLVQAQFEEGGTVVDARMSAFGLDYLAYNPHLRNPFPWQPVATIAATAAAIITLLVACSITI